MSSYESTTKTIALVIYEGLTPLDLVGPLQVLTTLAEVAPEFRIAVVAECKEIIKSDVGLRFAPSHTFAEVPHPYVVLVPGGSMPTIRAMSNPVIRRYLRDAAQSAAFVTSVCTGALVLAGLGLMKGRPATTHWAFYGLLESLGSRYERRRWVENGKVINSAGVSAGIDMALYLVARMTDDATARLVQQRMDYDPQPPFGRIDWDNIGFMASAMRLGLRIAAPLLTRKPRQLLQQGQ